MVGSLNLVQTLLGEKLFDRLDLWVHPVVLGVGKKVFDGGAVPTNVTLLEPPVAGPRGTLYLRYGLADGTPATGDMSRTRSRSRGPRLKSPIPYFDDNSPDGWFRQSRRERRESSLHLDTYTERRQAEAAPSGWHTRFRTSSSGHVRNPGEVARPCW